MRPMVLRWVERALYTTKNWRPEKAPEIVAVIYRLADLPPPATVLCLPSPMAALKAIAKHYGHDLKWIPPSDSAGWSGLKAHYLFFQEIAGLCPQIVDYVRLDFEVGYFFVWFFQDACFLAAPPEELHYLPGDIDRRIPIRLHSESRPAIRWSDGYEIYFWRGIRVPKKLIMAPEKITKKDFLGVTNTEIKRCHVERLGVERIVEILGGARVIDDDPQWGQLVEVALGDHNGRPARFINCRCPSTGREYRFSNRVPPDINTALDAQAWRFQIQANRYRRHKGT